MESEIDRLAHHNSLDIACLWILRMAQKLNHHPETRQRFAQIVELMFSELYRI